MRKVQRQEQQAIIQVKDLVKKFGKVTAVNGISFSIYRGQITGLLGPNGAGKTTTIQMLLDLITAMPLRHIMLKKLKETKIIH